MTLKNQLDGRLQNIGYKEGNYINFDRLIKILKSLRYVYIHNMDKGFSVIIGHEDKNKFPKQVRIISIIERQNQIWSLGIGYILSIEVGVVS